MTYDTWTTPHDLWRMTPWHMTTWHMRHDIWHMTWPDLWHMTWYMIHDTLTWHMIWHMTWRMTHDLDLMTHMTHWHARPWPGTAATQAPLRWSTTHDTWPHDAWPHDLGHMTAAIYDHMTTWLLPNPQIPRRPWLRSHMTATLTRMTHDDAAADMTISELCCDILHTHLAAALNMLCRYHDL
jgi:hypothetical protein